MDKGWINSSLFSKAHQDGVSEFMKFVSERFGDDEEIICPCRQCLNQVFGHRGLVQDLLYIHGMCSTDDKWIHHGEPLDAEINDNVGNLDEPIGFNEDVGMNVRKASMMMIIGFMTWWRSCIQLNNKMEVVAVNPCLQKY